MTHLGPVGAGQITKLANQTIVGIGVAALAEALALAEAGAEVVVNYANSADAANAVVATITAAGGKAYALKANVSIEAEVDGLIKAVLERSGRLDVLVNNAGISIPAPIDSDEYESAWAKTLDVLITAHTRTIRAALPNCAEGTVSMGSDSMRSISTSRSSESLRPSASKNLMPLSV